jgi:hypothetical protein
MRSGEREQVLVFQPDFLLAGQGDTNVDLSADW